MKAKIYKDTKRFTGYYVGEVGDMIPTEDTLIITVPNIPSLDDYDKALFYKWDTFEVQTGTKQVPVMKQETNELGELLWEDENKTIPKLIQETNEDGTLKYIEEPIMETKSDWFFEEEAYNTWVEEQTNKVPVPTNEEKIEQLENDNDMLSETLDYLLTVLMPSME